MIFLLKFISENYIVCSHLWFNNYMESFWEFSCKFHVCYATECYRKQFRHNLRLGCMNAMQPAQGFWWRGKHRGTAFRRGSSNFSEFRSFCVKKGSFWTLGLRKFTKHFCFAMAQGPSSLLSDFGSVLAKWHFCCSLRLSPLCQRNRDVHKLVC